MKCHFSSFIYTLKTNTLPRNKAQQQSNKTIRKSLFNASFPNNGSVTSNPLSWDTASTTDFNKHKEFLFSNGVIYDKALKIKITDGLVWTSSPHFPWRLFMVLKKNYHIGDVNLFWQDIRENSKLKTQYWLNK
jgi:hypothetical protein